MSEKTKYRKRIFDKLSNLIVILFIGFITFSMVNQFDFFGCKGKVELSEKSEKEFEEEVEEEVEKLTDFYATISFNQKSLRYLHEKEHEYKDVFIEVPVTPPDHI